MNSVRIEVIFVRNHSPPKAERNKLPAAGRSRETRLSDSFHFQPEGGISVRQHERQRSGRRLPL